MKKLILFLSILLIPSICFGGTLTTNGDETFSVNDILRLKDSENDEWMEITAVNGNTYTVTRDKANSYSANANPIWTKGMSITNYGASGDGVIYMTASEGNSPYIDFFTHAGSPWTTTTDKCRIGNLAGVPGCSGYGIWGGAGYLGALEVIDSIKIGSSGSIRSNLTGEYPYVEFSNTGLQLKDSDTGGTYGTAKYSNTPPDKYGYGASVWIGNRTLTVPYVELKEPLSTPNGGLDSYTKLCSHFDGIDGASAYTDPIAGAYTFQGTAQLDTAQKKFGSASLLLDGDSDYVTLPDSDDWNFGSGDFTIDFWIRFNVINISQVFIGQYQDSANYWYFCITTDNKLNFIFRAGGITLAGGTTSNAIAGLVTGDCYHIAFERNTTNCLILVNGVSQALSADMFSTIDVGNITSVLTVGSYRGTSDFVNGYIDELRISKGIARWTSNFTPYSTAYTNTGSVASMRLYNRSADPTGPAEVGDIAVVGGKLMMCIGAGTPGTWQIVGEQVT